MEDRLLPKQQIPLLHIADMVQWKGKSQYNWFQQCCRSWQNDTNCSKVCLLKPFPSVDIATRQWWFEIGVFLLLDGLPSKADEPQIPGLLPNSVEIRT